ncbi:MAG: hypothetical protein H6881_05240 [Rhodobiaceae bacterium]|nr:hypothetical protein [Rhodobiaceae bacterium]MCC0018169.1 hypothetical protein [Rhodobiaceae bacterium]MCC0051265.1 hypothetical protein [Rhodobiaceae bacterium]MCC0053094.1 hypothetical protein [Rhodobiaceae bacterium]
MKTLHCSIYRNGESGFSNLVMSLELGVVLTALTGRALVLEGNNPPTGNVVGYGEAVSNRHRSRVTDLIDPGLPWIEGNGSSAGGGGTPDICGHPAWDSAFYYPPGLSTQSEDFLAFARGRTSVFTLDEALDDLPALAFSGGPEANTLCFYSYFFYLDRAAQARAADALRNMKPRAPYRAFADQVAGDLGSFNAAHIRRGDFKMVPGKSTTLRKPAEAIAALDQHFRRDDLLVILTDERGDPFFDEIKCAYANHIFLDHHILERYGDEFRDLPMHDSIALAYLSQLIAARSRDFIGTMTSTFTALIQRMRGISGLEERFKFLWNDLPPPGEDSQPGSREYSDVVPLENSVMVEQYAGPYSWNRFNPRLVPAWMREWPEAFLDSEAMLQRAAQRSADPAGHVPAHRPAGKLETFSVRFQESSVECASDDTALLDDMRRMFATMLAPEESQPINRVRVTHQAGTPHVRVDGTQAGLQGEPGDALRKCYREVVRCFINAHADLVWIHAGAAASDHGAIVLPGPWGHGKSTLALELCRNGWQFLSDDIVPVDPRTQTAAPFPVTPKIRDGSNRVLSRDQVSALSRREIEIGKNGVAVEAHPVSMFVFPSYRESATLSLQPISAGTCVGKLLENSLSFPVNSDDVIRAFCRVVETRPAFELCFSDPAEAARLMIDTAASLHSDAGAQIQGLK